VFLATGWGVDLEEPDLDIGVEIGPYGTFLWSRNLRGAAVAHDHRFSCLRSL
jgi:adenylyl- and sulfurtransferase ThiI